jgi:hypothetical protein
MHLVCLIWTTTTSWRDPRTAQQRGKPSELLAGLRDPSELVCTVILKKRAAPHQYPENITGVSQPTQHPSIRASGSSLTPQAKPVRLAPIFVPGSKKPLPMPQWATPPAKRATGFALPTSSKEIEGILSRKVKIPAASRRSERQSNRKASSKLSSRDQSEDKDSGFASEPSYVEVEPFNFKAVISYVEGSGKDIDTYFHSTDLADRMQGLWSQVKQLSKQWEDAAGTDWAWELQRQSGGRLCVSSKLAKQSTKWPAGDNGYYACNTCTSRARLCFTWAADEEGKYQEGFAIPIPKGDFLCLPVHPDDRSCVEVAKGRELRYWLNERDESESDSSGEDVGEGSSEFDGYKTESDFDHLSDSESSTSEDAS